MVMFITVFMVRLLTFRFRHKTKEVPYIEDGQVEIVPVHEHLHVQLVHTADHALTALG